jgi:hypothetical protein
MSGAGEDLPDYDYDEIEEGKAQNGQEPEKYAIFIEFARRC